MQKNLSRLDRVSSIIHSPREFGSEISSLLGLLPSLTFSEDPPASHKFRLILDPGPVTVFPILEGCILRHYQETATSEVLEWFENWEMAAFRAQKGVKHQLRHTNRLDGQTRKQLYRKS
ncbi:hypothetical protein WJX77_009870 [Trebouxia sp. C0004]